MENFLSKNCRARIIWQMLSQSIVLFAFVNSEYMKCYRIRDRNRICFLMASQLARLDKKYDAHRQMLGIRFFHADGKTSDVQLTLNEEELALFDLRWERFQQSDEIFFDCAEFQEDV